MSNFIGWSKRTIILLAWNKAGYSTRWSMDWCKGKQTYTAWFSLQILDIPYVLISLIWVVLVYRGLQKARYVEGEGTWFLTCPVNKSVYYQTISFILVIYPISRIYWWFLIFLTYILGGVKHMCFFSMRRLNMMPAVTSLFFLLLF